MLSADSEDFHMSVVFIWVHVCVAFSQRPASVLVCSAECTVASEVHWYRVDKRWAARCEHAVQAHLIRGALTFYYKYLPQSLSPPFSCRCPSLCLPASFLHLLLCQTTSLMVCLSICLPGAVTI